MTELTYPPTTVPGQIRNPRKTRKPAQDDDNEKRSMVARSAREGSVDAVSFALPVLWETTFGHRGKGRILSRLADLVAPRGRYT